MAREKAVDLSAGEALPLGSRIRLWRQARGMRLSTLAEAVGYDRGYLSRVETNKATPSDELLGKIANQLGVSLDEIRTVPVRQTDLLPTPSGGLALPALSVWPSRPETIPRRPRSAAQRIERVVAMAHLSPDEETVVADYLVAAASDVLALVKALRDRSGLDSSRPAQRLPEEAQHD